MARSHQRQLVHHRVMKTANLRARQHVPHRQLLQNDVGFQQVCKLLHSLKVSFICKPTFSEKEKKIIAKRKKFSIVCAVINDDHST